MQLHLVVILTYVQTYSEAFADPTNSTVDYKDQSLFKVFPNPSSGEFTLMLSGSKTEVTIWDSSGRRIFTKMTQEKVSSIKLSEPGSYMLRIGTGSGIQTSRLIVR